MTFLVSKQERWKNRMCNNENAMANLLDTFANYLTKEANMFPGRAMVVRAKMLNDLGEIGKLSLRAECLADWDASIGKL